MKQSNTKYKKKKKSNNSNKYVGHLYHKRGVHIVANIPRRTSWDSNCRLESDRTFKLLKDKLNQINIPFHNRSKLVGRSYLFLIKWPVVLRSSDKNDPLKLITKQLFYLQHWSRCCCIPSTSNQVKGILWLQTPSRSKGYSIDDLFLIFSNLDGFICIYCKRIIMLCMSKRRLYWTQMFVCLVGKHVIATPLRGRCHWHQ